MVIEVKFDDSVFVLINIYNANTESEQLHTLNDLVNILETIEDIQNQPNPQFPADFVTFTEEILNGKLHFSCSEAPTDTQSPCFH